MLFADSLSLAIRAITAQRLRSFLTLLGIAVGIAAVILLTSIGEGIHRFVLGEFTQFGTNVITAVPGKTQDRRLAFRPAVERPAAVAGGRAFARTPAECRRGDAQRARQCRGRGQRPHAADAGLWRQCQFAENLPVNRAKRPVSAGR